MRYPRLAPYLTTLLLTIFLIFPSLTYGAAECTQPAGTLVSLQGKAEVLREGHRAWEAITLDSVICPGESIKVLEDSRAAIALANETVLRIRQNSALHFPAVPDDSPLLIKLLKGILHIFSHRPRSLKVETPYLNGAVEGTEFIVSVDATHTSITVFEGRIAAVNSLGQLDITSGQMVTASATTAPAYTIPVSSRDAVQWTLYYPFILDSAESIDPAARKRIDTAASLLAIGEVEKARAQLAEVLNAQPDNSTALALQAIIAVVRNENDLAMTMADKAVKSNPRSAPPRLALSYAQQARFDIEGALQTVDEAVVEHANNGHLHARQAELLLSTGDLQKALDAGRRAASLAPRMGYTQAILGFAHLSSIQLDQAEAAFIKAITLDQALPLARLGLGLTKIRKGNLEEGRREIEIAAALDPVNALLRSYLGKAYYEEKRDNHALRQYSMAKSLDPSDPTPWLYDAIRKQSVNRPIEALYDLQKSIELNDNRAVYRSRLLLDEDLAVRSASLGRIYNDLGFQQLALVEGWKSVNAAPDNFSAHRFLADSYGALPRHEIARVSELLQSQLLQPININPAQPQFGERNIFAVAGSGLSAASLNEYGPLFNRNRLALLADGVAGGNDTLGNDLLLSGVYGRTSFSLGQFHYESNGFRENNDQNQNIYNGFIQTSLSPKTSLQAEYRNTNLDRGDLSLRFNREFIPTMRRPEESQSARVGFMHALSTQAKVIGSFVWADSEADLTVPPYFSTSVDDNGYNGELQHLYRSEIFALTSGLRYFSIDRENPISSIFAPPSTTESTINQTDGYCYALINSPEKLTWTLGGSANFLNGAIKDIDAFNPKIGLTWAPLPGTTVRAAGLRMLRGPELFSQTIEPTQVAGFNQFFEDVEGTVSWRYGLGIDQRFSSQFNGGIELSGRDLEVPFTDSSSANITRESDWQESMTRVYLFWTPHPMWAGSIEYLYERFERDLVYTGDGNFHDLKTHRFPLGVSFFHPSGFSCQIKTTYIDQDGDIGNRQGLESAEDQFWIVDAFISYRLPRRLGKITLEARNLFDQDIHFQDTDPAYPDIYPEQLLLTRLTLSF